MTERSIALHPPRVDGHSAFFSWSSHPADELYERDEFRLSFPAQVDVAAVPQWLWWRIALLCLHAHWPLLRPCRVTLPERLSAAETEFWLRMTDATVAAIEAPVGGADTARTIEIWSRGRPLPPVAPLAVAAPAAARHAASNGAAHSPAPDQVVACFSSGRDSITQLALLTELGCAPTLVTVTSPVSWSNEHDTPRRRQVLAEISQRRPVEHIEVTSDLRANWRNGFCAERYEMSVNELSDTHLYLAAALAVAAARGARHVLMASEAEVQDSVRRDGMIIQGRHLMYSAATHRALSGLLAPSGIAVGSLTNSLRQFQVQRLLSDRYRDLRDLQYSCWELTREQQACSTCAECRSIALNLVASGVSPAAAGIDLATLLVANADWQPGSRYVANAVAGDGALPRRATGHSREMQELRCLAQTPPERLVPLLNGAGGAEHARLLGIWAALRERASLHAIEPEPGYRAGYLQLVDERFREGLRAILDEHFQVEPPGAYAQLLRNTLLVSGWVLDPLTRERAGARASPPASPPAEPVRPTPPAPATLSQAELAMLEGQIPDPEPPLQTPPGGRRIAVCETSLHGNELAYVQECVQTNWVSSAGPFVRRLEETFAPVAGAAHGVACSSGTAALMLAYAAAGIGPGDEVLMPAFTMVATANAAAHLGAHPVLVDSDPATWNLDLDRLADKLSRRTRAIVVVHTYGQPVEMATVLDFADRNGLAVIEDAAESHGATSGGRPVGGLGTAGTFSFYGNKIVTTGEGGIVTTNDPDVERVARELRDHAFSPERHFWHRRFGFNFRMSNLQAAVGLAQTERLDEILKRRALTAQRYREALAGIEGLGLPPQTPGSVNWVFGVTVEDGFPITRDELRRRLAARGVETRAFFVPMHLQPIYRERFAGQRYPVAEALCRTGLYLPSGGALTDDEVDYVAGALRESREARAGLPA